MINWLSIIGVLMIIISAGMLIRRLLSSPFRADVVFRKKMIKLIPFLMNYYQAVIDFLLDPAQRKEAHRQKQLLQKIWRQFPLWVFNKGFIPRLQQGHRYFLVHLEQLRQQIDSMHYLAKYHYKSKKLDALRAPIQEYSQQIKKLMQAIIFILTLQSESQEVDDLSIQFAIIENEFQKLVPYSLDGLEAVPADLHLASVIDELKQIGKSCTLLARTLT